jgi:hypothetical protein
MSDRAGSKVGLKVMPITSVTLSDRRRPGERAPTRRYRALVVGQHHHLGRA